MSLVTPGITRLVLAVDIESYSARLHLEQIREQDRLDRVVEHALTEARTDSFARQDSGDGVLLILPEGIDQTRVVPRLLIGLRDALEVDNRGRSGAGRLRMRASVGEGLVHVGKTGFASGVVIDVCRLLNSGPLKRALRAAADRDLVTAVTDHTYEQVVQHHYPGLDPAAFRQVEVDIPDKGFKRRAWIDAPLSEPPAVRSDTTPAQGAPPSGTPRAVSGAAGGSVTSEGSGSTGRGRARDGLDLGVRLLEGAYLAGELIGHHHRDPDEGKDGHRDGALPHGTGRDTAAESSGGGAVFDSTTDGEADDDEDLDDDDFYDEA
ncbi:hypothetical protein [Streptomyces sp. NPDC096132]|uniref:hypothetical protein n=1 Tax=Streptomyces sp. NPDC096132 TaxID=3366075 RepID=UPI003810BF75